MRILEKAGVSDWMIEMVASFFSDRTTTLELPGYEVEEKFFVNIGESIHTFCFLEQSRIHLPSIHSYRRPGESLILHVCQFFYLWELSDLPVGSLALYSLIGSRRPFSFRFDDTVVRVTNCVVRNPTRQSAVTRLVPVFCGSPA